MGEPHTPPGEALTFMGRKGWFEKTHTRLISVRVSEFAQALLARLRGLAGSKGYK